MLSVRRVACVLLCPFMIVPALEDGVPGARAATTGGAENFEGLYSGRGRVAVTETSARARKAGYEDRKIRFALGHATFSGTDTDQDGQVDEHDLAPGAQVAIKAKLPRAGSSRRRLAARRVRIGGRSQTIPDGSPSSPEPPSGQQPSDHRQWRGFDVGSVWHGVPEEDSVRDIREAAALGADSVRVDLRWYWLAPDSSGRYDADRVAHVDRLLEAAKTADLRVVAQASYSPCWASSAARQETGECHPEYPLYPPNDAADFGEFISWASTRWGDRIAAFEIWNEPNHPFPWRGTASQYVDLVREAANAVDASPHPDLPVVAGALSGSDTAYLQKLYDSGVARWSDAISVHPYSIRWGGDDQGFIDPAIARVGDMWSFAAGVPAIRATMRANGDRDPIWITEFGYPDCPATPYCVSPADQGAYLASAMETAASWDYVDVFLIYRLRDWYGSGSDWEFRYGILNGDWSQKPAAVQVSQALARLPR